MTSPDPKEGAALPDVWMRTLHGAIDWAEDCCYASEMEMREEETGGAYAEADGYGVERYTPASRVAELTERLERAVALLREADGCVRGEAECISDDIRAFLAAHQEPKP